METFLCKSLQSNHSICLQNTCYTIELVNHVCGMVYVLVVLVAFALQSEFTVAVDANVIAI